MKISYFYFIKSTLKNFFSYGIHYKGIYNSWNDADCKSTGYDSEIIINKLFQARKKVYEGHANYERDSVIFDKIAYPYELLSHLLYISISNKSKINIIDFGGSLGSTYFQCLFFLKKIKYLSWNIIEQKRIVDIGSNYFKIKNLNFYYSFEHYDNLDNTNIVLFSSSAQYIEDPYIIFNLLLKKQIKWIIFDRIPVSDILNDLFTIQFIPKKIYKANYPMRIFSYKSFTSFFVNNGYDIFSEYVPNWDGSQPLSVSGINFLNKGFVFKLSDEKK